MKNREKSLTLIVAGVGFLYFGWLFYTTGIYADPRGRALTAAEDPGRFSFAVGAVLVAGVASLVAGFVTRRRR